MPKIVQAGLSNNRVVTVECRDEKGVLDCFEESLRCRGVGAVIGELARLPMTASRRLQLAAEASGVLVIAIRRWRRHADVSDFGHPTAAVTRWRISVLPSQPLPVPGIGRARWYVELLRCRAAESADYVVEACDAKGRLGLPADLANRSPSAVAAANVAAIAAGLRIGMPASKAQALVAELIIEELRPRRIARNSIASRSDSCATMRRSLLPTLPTASPSIRPAPITCMATRH